jgi:GT2 family glycosyltransferase
MLDEIGSIDPLLWPMYHEDIELSYRAWKRGWRIRYAPDAVAHHRGGHSSKRAFSPTQLQSFVRQNEFLTVWKDVTEAELLTAHVLLVVPRLLLAALKRDWPTLIGFRRAARRLPVVRMQRRSARAHMRLSDREVLRRVSSIV